MPMKYCSKSTEKMLLMYSAALPKDQARYDSAWQIFQQRKMRVLLAARKAESIALWLYACFWKELPIHIDAKTWSYYLGETQLNFVWYLHSILQPPYLQRYAHTIAEKDTPLYNCFNFVDGTIACIFKTVLNERAVYSRHARVNCVKC